MHHKLLATVCSFTEFSRKLISFGSAVTFPLTESDGGV